MAYDVEMIKDFIEQLKWSLRVDHFEFTHGPKALNPELADEVKRCARKRGVLRLLALFAIVRDKPELTDEQMDAAVARFGQIMARRRDEQLRHLEALEECLAEAWGHAHGSAVMDINVPASRVLDGSWSQ
jgi:hypothetical protein